MTTYFLLKTKKNKNKVACYKLFYCYHQKKKKKKTDVGIVYGYYVVAPLGQGTGQLGLCEWQTIQYFFPSQIICLLKKEN